MRVLLSEGSGLTSRQTAQRLGELGHHVELLSSTQLCLSRFTRHVRAVHRVPQFGADPLGWLDAALEIARQRKVDLLFPTQEQVTVLSAQEKRLTVATIVPPFAALRRVQDKLSAFRTLAEIGASQPETVELFAEADLSDISSFPVFLKQPISTASSGVRKVANPAELRAAARGLGLGDRPLIAQSQVAGALAMVQAIADRGRLIGFHANLRVKEGVGGGAAIKRSTTIPGLADLLERIVARLRWRGGLSLDIILGAGGPVVIDVNPRLVEPANALFAGVDLVGAMLDIATCDQPRVLPPGRDGVVSHQLLLSILGAADHPGTRRAILRECAQALQSRGAYRGSREELTPIAGDWLAAVPVAAALTATLLHPRLGRKFQGGAVGAYAVTPKAWDMIVATAL
jgi:glutathione synthase/RimK-type ligase-like ATP-grasp enzyme